MPVSENLSKEDIGDDEYEKLDDGFVLTIEDAKKGLARTFYVPESFNRNKYKVLILLYLY